MVALPQLSLFSASVLFRQIHRHRGCFFPCLLSGRCCGGGWGRFFLVHVVTAISFIFAFFSQVNAVFILRRSLLGAVVDGSRDCNGGGTGDHFESTL